MYNLAVKPAFHPAFGIHDPSAAIFRDEELLFGVEEERFTRQKHAVNTFPENAVRACLEYCDREFRQVDRILLPYQRELELTIAPYLLSRSLRWGSFDERFYRVSTDLKRLAVNKLKPTHRFERKLASDFGEPVPPIETYPHHACHAASAFHPSGFDEALVLTMDGRGEYDSTVLWHGRPEGIERLRTYEFPNSLGYLFAAVTEYLGYYPFNGEGKIMGLAPYGNENPDIEARLRNVLTVGVDYDVTPITKDGHTTHAAERLADLFGRPPRDDPGGEFTQWEMDLAFTVQKLLEEIVCEIVRTYCARNGFTDIALAGGVALNCKLNKQVMELDAVDNIFIQPVAHDAGLSIGAGMLRHDPRDIPEMSTVYLGPEYSTDEITTKCEMNRIDYQVPENIEAVIADRIADGALVGWFQGRTEMGPRALGNRSILADPRSVESRDRVNKFVKHREEWRPFAPSMLESAAAEYLVNAEPAPYMIKTFDVKDGRCEEIEAVLHAADDTTRPQTVREEQNPRYYRLLREFEAITGVPVLLNTSFNDSGEPIVNTPTEAMKDFFGMGLDVLVIEDVMITK